MAYYTNDVFEDADWSHRADYITKRNITVEQANEALADEQRVVINPDYASKSGEGVRIIGMSTSYGALLTVILVSNDEGVFGANCWPANEKDQRIYREGK